MKPSCRFHILRHGQFLRHPTAPPGTEPARPPPPRTPGPAGWGGGGEGISCAGAVWIGPHASRGVRRAAWAGVRSLRFPALREGTIWDGYDVLGRASRYPAGSVTTFPAASLPGNSRRYLEGFYLMHAARAFYVITKVFQTQPPPSFKVFTCTVAFDPKRFQFYCPGTHLRWNRVGHPIGARAGSGPYWDLTLHVATVAQDGHVLVRPFYR